MPWHDGITLRDGVHVTPDLHATLAHMLLTTVHQNQCSCLSISFSLFSHVYVHHFHMQVPHLEMPPMPWRDGITLQDGVHVTPDLHATLAHMLELMNRGIDTLPDLSHRLNPARRQQ